MEPLCHFRTNAEGKVVLPDMQKNKCVNSDTTNSHKGKVHRQYYYMIQCADLCTAAIKLFSFEMQHWNVYLFNWDLKHTLAFAIVEMVIVYPVTP